MSWTWCLSGQEPWCGGWLFEKLAVPTLVAILVYRFAVLQLKKKRSIDFAEKQLAEFYAPMFGLRAQILSHATFDRYMQMAAFREVEHRQREGESGAGPDENYEEELQRYFRHISDRLLGIRLETYLEMRNLFARKTAYADADTREWFDYFFSFVEMWHVLRENDQHQRELFPSGVSGRLWGMFSEDLLDPFYEHLRDRCDYLQSEIAGKHLRRVPAPKPPRAE